MLRQIILARHQGFCMGVRRAIQVAEETASARKPGEKVTILNEIVHNEAVVEKFRREGVAQAFSVEEVEEGTLIISAHGIAPKIVKAAEDKGLVVVDATCPLVSRIYRIIADAVSRGLHIVHFGDPHHDETAGIVGQAPDKITVVGSREELLALPDWPERKLGLTVQTTAHVDLFREVKDIARRKWPQVEVFNTVCNATTQRQQAIKELARQVDMILVVGSRSSANSNRLVRISQAECGRGELINAAGEIDPAWFGEGSGVERIGVSAGASTPQFLVDEVLARLVEISGHRAEVIVPDSPGDTCQPIE